MSLLVLGINHNTAAVDVREKVAFVPDVMHEALQQACAKAGLAEIAILSTCNRTELFGVPDPAQAAGEQGGREGVKSAERKLLEWLADYHHLPLKQLEPTVYTQHDEAAVRHMMRVASGLDSMVLGEPQILGQIKSAYAVADKAGTIGSKLHRVF
ncbi:MAG: glutamyl-tRNA reductase, partial [Burkholderiales bacterium]